MDGTAEADRQDAGLHLAEPPVALQARRPGGGGGHRLDGGGDPGEAVQRALVAVGRGGVDPAVRRDQGLHRGLGRRLERLRRPHRRLGAHDPFAGTRLRPLGRSVHRFRSPRSLPGRLCTGPGGRVHPLRFGKHGKARPG
jgi:hypothetical protein